MLNCSHFWHLRLLNGHKTGHRTRVRAAAVENSQHALENDSTALGMSCQTLWPTVTTSTAGLYRLQVNRLWHITTGSNEFPMQLTRPAFTMARRDSDCSGGFPLMCLDADNSGMLPLVEICPCRSLKLNYVLRSRRYCCSPREKNTYSVYCSYLSRIRTSHDALAIYSSIWRHSPNSVSNLLRMLPRSDITISVL